jgi:hypothetical protein
MLLICCVLAQLSCSDMPLIVCSLICCVLAQLSCSDMPFIVCSLRHIQQHIVPPSHRVTETQRHRTTETHTHRITETQGHRDTKTQRQLYTETRTHGYTRRTGTNSSPCSTSSAAMMSTTSEHRVLRGALRADRSPTHNHNLTHKHRRLRSQTQNLFL